MARVTSKTGTGKSYQFESLVAQDTFDFRIVFRTFGSDLSDVVEEINDFCKGKHPLYPNHRKYDGSDPNDPRDFTIILPHQSACFRRNGEDIRAGIQLSYINKDKVRNSFMVKLSNRFLSFLLITVLSIVSGRSARSV